MQLIWADGGYAGKLIEWAKLNYGWVLEIVKRSDDNTSDVYRLEGKSS